MPDLKLRIVPLESDPHCAAVLLPDGRELARIVAMASDADGERWANVDVIATHADSGSESWPLGEHLDTWAECTTRRADARF